MQARVFRAGSPYPPNLNVYNPSLAGMETFLTQFVGRISLSAESLRIQFTIGRYGYLPYEFCGLGVSNRVGTLKPIGVITNLE